MTVAELIAKLQTLPQDAQVFTVDEYGNYTEIKHADFVAADEYGNDPHVQLSEYGKSIEDDE